MAATLNSSSGTRNTSFSPLPGTMQAFRCETLLGPRPRAFALGFLDTSALQGAVSVSGGHATREQAASRVRWQVKSTAEQSHGPLRAGTIKLAPPCHQRCGVGLRPRPVRD